MLKHGILGLLNYGEKTGYELMEVFRDSLNFFWSAQTSQIYRELQTLKKKGFVNSRSVTQQGKPDKNVFSITEEGKKELKRWLQEEETGLDSNSPLLMRTFFRGELLPGENIAFFRRIRKECEAFFAEAAKPSENIAFYQGEMDDPLKALYWKMTVEFGTMYIQMMNDWAKKCEQELEEIIHAYSAD